MRYKKVYFIMIIAFMNMFNENSIFMKHKFYYYFIYIYIF